MNALRRGCATAVVATLAGCARPLLGPEPDDAAGDGDSSSGAALESSSTDDGGDSSSGVPAPACHPSYAPCLPLVDDLDCPDVIALGLAPVMVEGEDAYGLDGDGDGIGCED